MDLWKLERVIMAEGEEFLLYSFPLQTSADFFYTSIRTEFKLGSLFDLLEFTDALDKLEG